MIRCLNPACLVGAIFLVPLHLRAVPPEQIKHDEQVLRDAGLKIDGPSLIEFFKARTPGARKLEDIQKLVRDLGSDNFRVRRRATDELLRIGPAATKPLQDALSSKDPEVLRRARDLLKIFESSSRAELIAASARLLADRRPAGAVQALFDYVAVADDGYLLDEVHTALETAGVQGGKIGDVLRQGIKDAAPRRRAAAGEVLVRSGNDEDRKAAAALLKDADPQVRIRVALALVERKDKDAVEPLIGALAQSHDHLFWRIEQILTTLGGEKGPQLNPGTTPAERAAFQAAWKKWWADNGAKADLKVLDDAKRTRGLTLVVQLDARVAGKPGVVFQGRVFEVGRDGRQRWEIKDLNYPLDAQMIGQDRVLVVEYRSRTVTERNLKGQVLWQHAVNDGLALSAQRLENGNTVIVSRASVVEVNKAGEEIQRLGNMNGMIVSARRLRTGETLVIERTGMCQRYDAKGKLSKQFQLAGAAMLSVIGSQADVAPNGNIIVPLYSQNKVVEYDGDGKAVWECASERPTAVSRLPNGNTLISSRYSNKVVEVDRAQKKVWEFATENGTALLARRR